MGSRCTLGTGAPAGPDLSHTPGRCAAPTVCRWIVGTCWFVGTRHRLAARAGAVVFVTTGRNRTPRASVADDGAAPSSSRDANCWCQAVCSDRAAALPKRNTPAASTRPFESPGARTSGTSSFVNIPTSACRPKNAERPHRAVGAFVMQVVVETTGYRLCTPRPSRPRSVRRWSRRSRWQRRSKRRPRERRTSPPRSRCHHPP